MMKRFKDFSAEEHFAGITVLTILFGVFLYFICKLNDVGTYLSGIGTFGIFMLAIIKIPEELEKNRKQRHEDKVFEVTYELMELVEKLRLLAFNIKYGTGDETVQFVSPEDRSSRFVKQKTRARNFSYRYKSRLNELGLLQGQVWKVIFLNKNKGPIKTKLQDFFNLIYIFEDVCVGILEFPESGDDNEMDKLVSELNNSLKSSEMQSYKDELNVLLQENINVL